MEGSRRMPLSQSVACSIRVKPLHSAVPCFSRSRTERFAVMPATCRLASFPTEREGGATFTSQTQADHGNGDERDCQVADHLPFTKESVPGTSSLAFLTSAAAALGPVTGMMGGLNATDPLSVAKALGILTVVVAVHECGHFVAARLQNIHVSKFAIGFGPPVVRYQGRIVEYSLRALPLGGFVAFPDDDPESPYPEDDPDLLRNRPVSDRAWVVSAGVIANILFAFGLLLAQASTVGVTSDVLQPGVVIPKVLQGSAADEAGIVPGDVILAVNGRVAAPDPSTVDDIVKQIMTHPNQELSLLIDRQGEQRTFMATPSKGSDGQGRLGMQLVAKRQFSTQIAGNPIEAVQLASGEFLRLNGEILNGLRQLVFHFSQSAEQVSGPVAIIAMGAEVARLNAPQLYVFAAIVNLNLAIVNTLPLPALDGGYFALLLIEALRGGKKLPQKIEQGVMASGILFLTAVGCLLLVRDTVHLASL